MAEAPSTASPPGGPKEGVSRNRKCLRCQAVFESEWAGERICARCKNTAAWRAGKPGTAHPVNRRR